MTNATLANIGLVCQHVLRAVLFWMHLVNGRFSELIIHSVGHLSHSSLSVVCHGIFASVLQLVLRATMCKIP